MLLHKADALFANDGLSSEPKRDGIGLLPSLRDGSVRLLSRSCRSFARLFGLITDALRGLPTSIVLDGEVIAINDKGPSDFEALQARFRPRNGKLPGTRIVPATPGGTSQHPAWERTIMAVRAASFETSGSFIWMSV